MVKKRKPPTVKKRPPVRIEPPAELEADEQAIWDELLREAGWITRFDRFNLHVFVCSLAKYKRDPQGASNSLLNRIKSLSSKLGYDATSRRNFSLEQRRHKIVAPDLPTANETPEEAAHRERIQKYFPPAVEDPPEEDE